jgi:O-antigen/teichoic acid export membrane protein
VKSLRQNFAWTLAGNFIYAASQWGMLIVLTKLVAPEQVGQFAFGLAVTGPVMVLSSLSLRSIQATDVRREYSLQDYAGVRYLMLMIGLGILACTAGAGECDSATIHVVMALGLARSIEALSDLCYGMFQRRERMDLIAISMILKGILSLAAFGVTVWWTGDVVWAALVLGGSWLIIFVAYDLRAARSLLVEGESLWPEWGSAKLGKLLLVAWPLGLGQALRALEINVPRYLISHQMGERELGIFSAIAYLTVAGTQIVNALGQSAAPRLATFHASGDSAAFYRLLRRLLFLGAMIGAAGVAVAWLGGSELLAFLYSQEYADRTPLFTWMMLAAGITYAYVFLGTALNSLRQYRVRIPLHCAAVIVTCVLCTALGRTYGSTGIAWGICLAEGFSAAWFASCIVSALRKFQPMHLCAARTPL